MIDARPVILCCEMDPEEYGYFVHEADMMLHGLVHEMDAGRLTLDDVRERWAPYRDLYPDLYEEYEDPDDGPYLNADEDLYPASIAFQREAAKLEIPGVDPEPDMGRPVSFALDMRVHGREALHALSRALADWYHIVLLPDDMLIEDGTPEEAQHEIEWARRQPTAHEAV